MSYYLGVAASTANDAFNKSVDWAKWSIGYGGYAAVPSTPSQQGQSRSQASVSAARVENTVLAGPAAQQMNNQAPQPLPPALQSAQQAQAMDYLGSGYDSPDIFLTLNQDSTSHVCFRYYCQQDSSCCKCAESVCTVGKDILCCISKCLGQSEHLAGKCCEAIPSCLQCCEAIPPCLHVCGSALGSMNC